MFARPQTKVIQAIYGRRSTQRGHAETPETAILLAGATSLVATGAVQRKVVTIDVIVLMASQHKSAYAILRHARQ